MSSSIQGPNREIQPADRAFALDVVQRLRDAGFVALWAGGCVRDLLMGNKPSDYDVATSATPRQVRKLFGNQHTLPVGASFGVIIVLCERRAAQQIEVATFRTDAVYSDGRRPDAVTFSTAEQDAERRDFTINGMFFDPIDEQVIDYVGGRVDLEQRVVRAIGQADKRIAEDKLRMLCAIRFAARFDFELERETAAAIARHAPEISLVSGERIADEIRKTLMTARAGWAVRRWFETGLMSVILPELAEGWHDWQSEGLELLGAVQQVAGPNSDWHLRLAALLWVAFKQHRDTDLVAPMRSRLKLSNEDARVLHFVLSTQRELEDADRKPWSQIQPLLIQPHTAAAIGLFAARSIRGETRPETAAWLRERSEWAPERLNPPPLVAGSDLIRMGFKPGPAFSRILADIRAQQLDGQQADRSSALRWLETQRANH